MSSKFSSGGKKRLEGFALQVYTYESSKITEYLARFIKESKNSHW